MMAKNRVWQLMGAAVFLGASFMSGTGFAESAAQDEAVVASTSIEKPSVFMSKIVNDVVNKLNDGEVSADDASDAQEYIVNLLSRYVDVQFMARYIVGPKLYSTASSGDQESFDDALTHWVANLYYGAFKLYDPKTTKISLYPVRVNYQTAKSVLVHSVIRQSHASQITVDYRCKQDDGEWKLYDLCVDNVCVLQNLRSQVTQIAQDIGSQAALPDITQRIVASTNAGSDK